MEKNVIYIYMWMKVKVRDPKNDMQQHGWELELCSFENPAIIVKLLPSLTTTTWKNRMLAHQLEPLAPSKNGPPQLKLNWKMKPNLGHRRLIGTAGHTHPARQFPKFIDSVKTSPDLLGLFRFQVHESGKEDKLGILHKQRGWQFTRGRCGFPSSYLIPINDSKFRIFKELHYWLTFQNPSDSASRHSLEAPRRSCPVWGAPSLYSKAASLTIPQFHAVKRTSRKSEVNKKCHLNDVP